MAGLQDRWVSTGSDARHHSLCVRASVCVWTGCGSRTVIQTRMGERAHALFSQSFHGCFVYKPLECPQPPFVPALSVSTGTGMVPMIFRHTTSKEHHQYASLTLLALHTTCSVIGWWTITTQPHCTLLLSLRTSNPLCCTTV